MHAASAVARRPLLPRRRTGASPALHHGLLRSAFTGEADAILTARAARARPRRARRRGDASCAGSPTPSSSTGVTVVNFHIDGEREQFDRVLALAPERVDRRRRREPRRRRRPTASRRRSPGSIDQILVRGLELRDGPSAWPLERRVVDGRVLSDHAPVEAVVGVTLRGGTRAVPGARAPRVPQRRLERAAPAGRRSKRCGRGSSAISTEGRSGKAYIEEIFDAARASPRAASPPSSAPPRSSSRSPTRRRAAARSSSPGSASARTTRSSRPTEEHFGLLGPLHASGARVVVAEADEDALLAAVTPRTRLIAVSHVLWTTGRRLDLARLRQPGRAAAARRRRAVGRRDPGRPRRCRLLHRLRAEVAVRPRSVRRALRARSGAAARRAPELVLAADRHEPDGSFVPKDGARRFDSGWIGAPALAGLEASLAVHPGLALRARREAGRALPRAARAARRDRDAAGRLDARLVPPAGRSRPSSSRLSPSGACRPRAPGPRPRPRLVRLVDERGRPAPARRRARRTG